MSPKSTAALATACAMLLGGCYPLHASFGHFDLMARRQPLADALDGATLADDQKSRLQRVVAIREFASRELGLPDNGSYRRYAPLDREFPAWNVWIAPEFDLRPRQSCFPVVGCVPYRGYFSKRLADEYAARFAAAGDDVAVDGVAAYSTLGFFDDPVTSTMLRLPEERIAGLIFHELSHQVVFVRDNATFNESFARAVEIEGTLRWLASRNDEAGLARYRAALDRADVFFGQVKAAREALAELYASPAGAEEKSEGKKRLFEAMRKAHEQRRALDPAWSAYDAWFGAGLNNARLAAVATYFDDVEMFRKLLRDAGGDFRAFYEAVRLKAKRAGRRADEMG